MSIAYHLHYKFHFEDTNGEYISNALIYDIWISLNKDKVELVIEGLNEYDHKFSRIIVCEKITND